LLVCGKTGTAQIKNARGETIGHTFWFISFAPYDRRDNEKPRYAVVVMVESDGGGSGGLTCAPVARDIYAAIQKIDGTGGAKALAQGK
jgi:cell division protein FtsI/penicillin-binding protein 2